MAKVPKSCSSWYNTETLRCHQTCLAPGKLMINRGVWWFHHREIWGREPDLLLLQNARMFNSLTHQGYIKVSPWYPQYEPPPDHPPTPLQPPQNDTQRNVEHVEPRGFSSTLEPASAQVDTWATWKVPWHGGKIIGDMEVSEVIGLPLQCGPPPSDVNVGLDSPQ